MHIIYCYDPAFNRWVVVCGSPFTYHRTRPFAGVKALTDSVWIVPGTAQ